MRARKFFEELVEWRWAPAAALSLGALAYVALAITVIPEQFGANATARSESRRLGEGPPATTSLYAARIGATLEARTDDTPEPQRLDETPAPAPPPEPPTRAIPVEQRRGFSPPLPRPEPPPPPVMVPPEPPPPPQPEVAPPAPPAEARAEAPNAPAPAAPDAPNPAEPATVPQLGALPPGAEPQTPPRPQ